MKHLTRTLSLLVVLLCSAAAFGQQVTDANGITFKYDKFKDKSHYFFSGYGIGLMEGAGFLFDGAELAKDQDQYYLSFRGTSCRGFCFNNVSLILLVDNERLNAGNDSGLSDSVLFLVPRETIAKIAAAKTVEYQVGRFEGKWEAKTINKFKALLAAGTKTP